LTLRTRLLLSLAALLAMALVVSGSLVVGLTRANLVAQVDEELRTARASDIQASGPGPRRGDDPTGRRFALLILDANGQLIESAASGFARDPDPLPSLPDGGVAALPVGGIIERPAVDGSASYRLLTLQAQRGLLVVLGAPLQGVEEAVGVLVGALLLVGVVVLAAMVAAGWLIIRRDLRPLEQMTGTAESISAGDLSRRVGMGDDRSEVGRLGQAFDAMLDQIQSAFDSQRAALTAKERSEGQLRQFVADASHELRTPLTTVRGYADLYQAGGLEERETLEQAMTRIGTESRRMAALVEDLLLLARLDQGRPLRRDPVSLSSLVRDAVGDARAVEPERPMRAEISEGVMVTGDEDRLRQVIANMFANFRVHTPPDAAVEISLATDDGLAALRVADHGPGVDPRHADRIFDRFYRGDPARSRDRGGSGLGLALAGSVAAVHGGSIQHEPTPGGGATFTLRLPRT
jgi:two-component system OmpR family sensor kinase